MQGAQVGGLQALLGNMGGVQGSEGQYYAHRQMSTQARALVYENDSAALRLLVDLLQRQGVYVMPAPTPQDFAQSLARDSYDIIFFSALPLSSSVTAALKNTRYCRRWTEPNRTAAAMGFFVPDSADKLTGLAAGERRGPIGFRR
jgi:hypothetical protein